MTWSRIMNNRCRAILTIYLAILRIENLSNKIQIDSSLSRYQKSIWICFLLFIFTIFYYLIY